MANVLLHSSAMKFNLRGAEEFYKGSINRVTLILIYPLLSEYLWMINNLSGPQSCIRIFTAKIYLQQTEIETR